MVSKRARSPKTDARHFRLYHAMTKTEAWASLTCAQRSVYLALGMKFNGYNNGTIGLSAREAGREANCNKDTALTALKTLEDRGFIQRTQRGDFNYKLSHSSLYRLTHLPVEHGSGQKPATHDYRCWRPRKKCGPK